MDPLASFGEGLGRIFLTTYQELPTRCPYHALFHRKCLAGFTPEDLTQALKLTPFAPERGLTPPGGLKQSLPLTHVEHASQGCQVR